MTTISPDITALFPKGGGIAAPLTEEQKTAAEEILSQYDPESLTEDDVDAIKQQLSDSGIGPSRELKTLLNEAGFDAEAFRARGGPGRPEGAPPPPPPADLSEEALTTLASIFQGYDAENLTEENLLEIQRKLQDAGFGGNGSVIDQQA